MPAGILFTRWSGTAHLLTNTWTTVASMPAPRSRLAAIEGRDWNIYAIGGGEPTTASNTILNTVEKYLPGQTLYRFTKN